MNEKEKTTVYEATGARVFYNKALRVWIALWLEHGHEHRVMFAKGAGTAAVIAAITEKRLTDYTFSK